MHADLHGAATCIIRNPSNDPTAADQISEAAKLEAGQFTVRRLDVSCGVFPALGSRACFVPQVCNSAAWAANTPSNAWWVYANQVSKTAPAGEYLSTGSFMIRGKKNMLPPCKLEMGLALLWLVEEGAPVTTAPGATAAQGGADAAADGGEDEAKGDSGDATAADAGDAGTGNDNDGDGDDGDDGDDDDDVDK